MSNEEDMDLDLLEVEHDDDDIVEVCSGRRAVSSGEPSLDGSVDVDEERGALSDSEISKAARTNTIAAQVKGPSSDALEESCRLEAAGRSCASDWEDVLGSGQLLKKTIIPANVEHSHHRPKDGQWVVIKAIDTWRGVDSHSRLRFITGYSMVIDAWELIVKLMNVGETCAVRAKALIAYGDIGLDDIIPPGQDLEYTIELLEIEDSPDFNEMNNDELMEFVIMVKERGNYYFNRKEYDKAIFVYKRATRILEEPPESEDLRKLFSALHSNLAVCYSKLGDVAEVLRCTEESLKLHSGNPKALYHRSVAHSSRSEFEEAADCLKHALLFEPNDMTITNELNKLTGLRRRCQQNERVLYKKMLAGSVDKPAKRNWWTFTNPLRVAVIIFFVLMTVAFVFFLSKM